VKAKPRDHGVEPIKNRGGHSQMIGYARVSRTDQNLESQLDQLKAAGCCRIYAEKVSGASAYRPAFAALQETLRKGDTVVVVRLDRLSRRPAEFFPTVELFHKMGVHIRDLKNGINTGNPHGRMLMGILMVLAETEREWIRERTRDGLTAAAERGRKGGRPVVLTDAKREQCRHLASKRFSVREIAVEVGVSESTVRNALADPRQPLLPHVEAHELERR
jgi:DNA invertase Pin-like site-specific DNA recombinase